MNNARNIKAEISQLSREQLREKITIRQFNSSDLISELTGLLHRAHNKHLTDGLEYVAAMQTDETTIHRINKGECWVAELDAQIIGVITISPPNPKNKNKQWYRRERVFKFYQFAVEPDLQGLGIGSMMLTAMEKRALELDAVELAGHTAIQAKNLIEMYISKGYRIVEYVFSKKTNYDAVIFSKNLIGDQSINKPLMRLLRKLRYYNSFIKCKLKRLS